MAPRTGTRVGLIALTGFGALSAVAGGVGLLGGGLDFPKEWLEGSPFGSYVGPGVILGAVVGGSQLAALVATLRHHERAMEATALAGAIMMGWIAGEVLIVGSTAGIMRNLQMLYFLHGLLEVGLVGLALRGRRYAR